MRMLLTNDDGIGAPGIHVLAETLAPLGQIEIVAPSENRSGISHAITCSHGLRATRIDHNGRFFGHAVNGNPADCVKLALLEMLDQPPDIVVSGINHGQNTGISTLYSGTVGGATEGTLQNIPSIAFSIASKGKPHWATAARVARDLVEHIHSHPFDPQTLLNVNIPNQPFDNLRGYAVTSMAASRYVNEFSCRARDDGQLEHWIEGDLIPLNDDPDSDISRLREQYITLTPIQFDLTAYSQLEALRANIRPITKTRTPKFPET